MLATVFALASRLINAVRTARQAPVIPIDRSPRFHRYPLARLPQLERFSDHQHYPFLSAKTKTKGAKDRSLKARANRRKAAR